MAEYDYNPTALRLAVLVDGDNAQPDTLEAILGVA